MTRLLVALFLWCCAASPLLADDGDLAPLVRWLPGDMNAVAIVRVADLLESERGREENWRQRADAAFLAGAMTLPADVELYVRGSHLHLGAKFADWSVALLHFSRKVDMQRLAHHEGADVLTIKNHPAVRSPRNCYFARLDPNLLGVVSPAFRQDFVRWLTRAEREDPPTSKYIATTLQSSSAPVAMAIDLADMFEPDRLRAYLAASPALRGREADVEQMARLFETILGMHLAIDVHKATEARLTIDFSEPIDADPLLFKGIILEVMADRGAAIDSFESGTPSVSGSSFVLDGPFSDEDLRRVMSLLTSPHPAGGDAPASSETPASGQPRVSVEASSRYFLAVDQILNDLSRANRKAKDYARTAGWHDNFASKIDHLPTVAVDAELIRYGESVASRLRALAASLRGVAVDINTTQHSVTYNVSVDPGWQQFDVIWGSYGYQAPSYNVTSNLGEVREKQAAAIAGGAKDRDQIWTMMTDDRNQTLNRMREVYGSDFAGDAK